MTRIGHNETSKDRNTSSRGWMASPAYDMPYRDITVNPGAHYERYIVGYTTKARQFH